MKLQNIIFGAVISAIGIGIGYIDYFLLSLFYSVSSWISSLVNAPEAVTLLLTLVLILFFLGIIIVIAVLAFYVFIWGVYCILQD